MDCDALKDWEIHIASKLKIDVFPFILKNSNMLPRKPKISYRYLKLGIHEFHRSCVLVPADKAATNVVFV